MRLILLVAISPLLIWAQYPNRPAAHAPAPFALGGPPPRTGSAAKPPRAPQPIGGLPYGAERGRSHSSGKHDRRGGAVGYLVGAPFYYSYGDYGSSIFDTPPEDTNDPAANLLGEQIQRLSAQVEQLRIEQQQQAAPPPPAAAQAPRDPPPVAAITVVLRDGRQLHVVSYAVMNQVFWDFSQQTARRIPVADIDVAASTKATEAAGGEFPELTNGR